MQTQHARYGTEYVSVGEAAAMVEVSVDTIRRWERAGRINALRTPTGHRRFKRADVERLLTPSNEALADGEAR